MATSVPAAHSAARVPAATRRRATFPPAVIMPFSLLLGFFFLSKKKTFKIVLGNTFRGIAKSRAIMLFAVVPMGGQQGQSLGLWDNVGVPRKMWGTQKEPGPEWYNNAPAPHNCVGGSEVQCPVGSAVPPPNPQHFY